MIVDFSLVMQAILPASMHGANKHSWSYLWSAKGAPSLEAWGTAPGMESAAENKALKARFNCLVNPPLIDGESRFQRCTYLDDAKPGALPQATGDMRLWR